MSHYNPESDPRNAALLEMINAARELTSEDVMAFFDAKNASGPCPICGHPDWNIIRPETEGVAIMSLLKREAIAAPKTSGVVETVDVPLVMALCASCGFARRHSAFFVAKWKLERAKERAAS